MQQKMEMGTHDRAGQCLGYLHASHIRTDVILNKIHIKGQHTYMGYLHAEFDPDHGIL